MAWFLANACPDHHVRGGPAHAVALDTAERILERYPDVSRASFHTAVVCGDIAEVERLPGETPLMRLPVDDAIALEIVELMLGCGVDPTLRNARGLTAAELATRRGMQAVSSVLRNAERAWRESST